MPELPEVETVRNILKKAIINKTIVDVLIWKSSIVEGDDNVLINTLKNKTILDIERMGKFLIFKLSDDVILLSHLRMEGKYNEVENINIKNKHTRVQFVFSDNTVLNYDDSRAFGFMGLRTSSNYKIIEPLSTLGVEPISNYDLDKLYLEIIKHKAPIKETILNQKIIAGIGNIYADETLFESKIHPLTPSNLITKSEFKLIMENAKNILNRAIELGGSTIKSYHPKEGIDGKFQNEIKVYNSKNKPCPNCNTPLHKIFIRGRGTTYCPKCQKNPALAKFIAITGPIASGKSSVLNKFKNLGYKIISSDELVNNLYNDPKFLKLIWSRFKLEKMDSKSTKLAISKLISNNIKEKEKLEKIIHPIITNMIIDIHFSSKEDDKIIFEIPVLIKSGLINFVDKLIYVDAKEEIRIKRLEKRNINAKELLEINKKSVEYKSKQYADFIINNNGDLLDLENQIININNKLHS